MMDFNNLRHTFVNILNKEHDGLMLRCVKYFEGEHYYMLYVHTDTHKHLIGCICRLKDHSFSSGNLEYEATSERYTNKFEIIKDDSLKLRFIRYLKNQQPNLRYYNQNAIDRFLNRNPHFK